jgi:hypothetical protein
LSGERYRSAAAKPRKKQMHGNRNTTSQLAVAAKGNRRTFAFTEIF